MRKVLLFVLGVAIFGCRNDPIVIYRDVVVVDDAEVRDDLNIGDDANIGGTITVDHIVADSANIGGVIIEDGAITTPGNIISSGTVTAEDLVANDNVEAGNDVIATDDVVAGDDVEYVGEVVEVPIIPSPDNDNGNDNVDEPAPLMSSLRSESGKDHFKVGEDVKMIFTFSGGTPPYDSRCLIVDGTFATEENSTDNSFTFKRRTSVKVINAPGSGVITCRVTSADGQQISSSFTVYVGQ